MSTENLQVIGRLAQGALYRLKEVRYATVEGQRVLTEFDYGSFRLASFPFDMTTRRPMVFFVGAEGPDAGRTFVCTANWFARRAELVPEVSKEEPPASFEEAAERMQQGGPRPEEPTPITPPPPGGKVAGWIKPPLTGEDAKQF